MSELVNPANAGGIENVDFRLVASGALDPASAIEFQQRVFAAFSGIDGLKFSITIGTEELPAEPLNADTELTPEAKARQRWLGEDIGRVLEETASVRATNALAREGIKTRRDVLLWGRQGLLDIRNFGAKCLSEVEPMINDNEYGIELQRSPDLKYAATICDDLSQVPARLYIRMGGDYTTSLAQLVNMSIDDIYTHYVHKRPVRVYEDGQYIDKPYTPEEQATFEAKARNFKAKVDELAEEFASYKSLQ